ncbi:MAG: hypothetical protein EA393_04510 [Bacteroidetes bacterium]|nr:MAG: hypothetical protein EA393_04510 [Bacteroidota bacterium]
MEFKYDLLKKQARSWYLLFFGWFISIFSIYFDLMVDGDLFKFIVFFLIGMLMIFRGYGFPLERLFGKKYIHITADNLRLKPRLMEKERQLNWGEINTVQLWPGKMVLFTKNNGSQSIDISKLDQSIRHSILDSIAQITEQKGIKTVKHGYVGQM